MSTGLHAEPDARFAGLRVLVVEDETMVSFMFEDMLRDLGCADVWHAANVDEALDILGKHRPDAAVLDINLNGALAYPIAQQLEASHVPFIFATGYGRKGVPDNWSTRLVIQKPFKVEALANAVASALRIG